MNQLIFFKNYKFNQDYLTSFLKLEKSNDTYFSQGSFLNNEISYGKCIFKH